MVLSDSAFQMTLCYLGWNSFANMLYIDQPAGTGFSYVTNPEGYVKNERTIGMELWNMMLKFYELYPKYANLDLYIFGESYGKKNIILLSMYS